MASSFTQRRPGTATPLHVFRQPPRAYADSTKAAIRSGVSPFELAESWEQAHDRERLSGSARSAWRQYTLMCQYYGRPPTPITVVALVSYMLWYVCMKLNSSANLNSELSSLHAYARSVGLEWPDFSAQGSGSSMTARISKIQKDWPAEVRGAPALTRQVFCAR